MRIGIFTDTYIPQISGVCTSISTLQDQLKKLGHTVYIFTTTDPLLSEEDIEHEDDHIIRFRSVPFISMPERRIVMAGLGAALKITRTYDLDIIHTQTEFGVGILGKIVASRLHIPVVHTAHTKYEDYLHYIAGGRLIKPGAVKYIMRTFLMGTEAVICPSEMRRQEVVDYGVKAEMRIIPTGIEVEKFTRPDISQATIQELRKKLDITPDETLLLSLSRLSYEKNIQAVINALPQVLQQLPVRLVVVGDGPYMQDLKHLVHALSLDDYVTFVGAIQNEETVIYYKAADFFISASTSETQGLTYSEALAAGTPVLAAENSYLRWLIDEPQFGSLFASDEAIAPTILTAIHQGSPMTQEAYEHKLFEVSAEAFGKNVVRFYKDIIAAYAERPSRMENLSESMSQMTERATDNLTDLRSKLSAEANKASKMTERTTEAIKTVPIKVRSQSVSITKKIIKYVKINRKKEKEKEDKQ